MRLLVSGSRDWTDTGIITQVLEAALTEHPELVLIEGEARGADSIAANWAVVRGLDTNGRLRRYPAHWQHSDKCPEDCREKAGRAAGAIRNRRMLNDGKPDLVYVFHRCLKESAGTLDMCYAAAVSGVPVWWWDSEGRVQQLASRQIGDWKRARTAEKKLDKQPKMF